MCVCCAARRRHNGQAAAGGGFSPICNYFSFAKALNSSISIYYIIIYFLFRTFFDQANISSFAPVVVNFCINKVKNCTTVTATLCPLTSARAAVSFTTNCICKRTANEYAKISRERMRERERANESEGACNLTEQPPESAAG